MAKICLLLTMRQRGMMLILCIMCPYTKCSDCSAAQCGVVEVQLNRGPGYEYVI